MFDTLYILVIYWYYNIPPWGKGDFNMTIIIDSSVKEALIKDMEKHHKPAVRLIVKGFGWAGPSFGIVLDEQAEKDDVVTVQGINFIAEKDISFLFENANIIQRKSLFGSYFDVSLPNSSGSC